MARVSLIRLKAPFRRLTVGDTTTVSEDVGAHLVQQGKAALLASYDSATEEVDERTGRVRPRSPPREPQWVAVELPEGELVQRLVADGLAVELARYDVGHRPASLQLPPSNGHAAAAPPAAAPAEAPTAPKARARS